MRNQLFGALIIGTALTFSSAALAEHHEGHDSKRWEEMKNMSPEERAKFHAERKAKWEALSDAEKVKMIEERRAERRKEMDAKWNAMSDAEKIQNVEKRMERKQEMRKHHKEMGGDDSVKRDMPVER